jgi:hypothetical protein
MVAQARLGRILFPAIQSRCGGIELTQLSPAEAGQRLLEVLLAPCRPWRYATAFERFGGPAPDMRNIERQCQRLAEMVPAFVCAVGRDVYSGDLPWTTPRRHPAHPALSKPQLLITNTSVV